MSELRFIAQYELILGRQSRINNYIIPKSLVSPQKISQGVNGVNFDGTRFSTSPDGTTIKGGDYLDYNTDPPNFWSIRDLQITAKINQTKENGTPCSITVTNLPDEITKFLRTDDSIIFRAGYRQATGNFVETFDGTQQESLPDLFVGQIQRVVTSFDDVDKVTIIECSEGQVVRRNSRISYSWPPLTPRKKVITDILDLLKKQGQPTGEVVLPPEGSLEREKLNAPFLSGYTVQGGTVDELEKLCKATSLNCYTVLGKVYVDPAKVTQGLVIPSTSFTQKRLTLSIKPQDVIGTIEPINGESSVDPSNSNGKAETQQIGVEVFLDGRISVNSLISMSGFDDYDGDYEITSVVHNYNHREEGCTTTLTLKSLI